ncbi:exo-alpha-sialidase [Arsukibacterium sp.]|uniref:exo-alpha-sialidase n=1 Tax=Arsukibacterium sp. TaxID=1977258 RepID=UPI00299F0F38|nr:exo-alpha-sialidase [Arsukibacterium sp.]MDX1678000.1 exo-alpha-sialidase [Arsukibacterium sp.]
MLTTRCIWQQAEHNAFTDLIWFGQALWCVFREGSAHVSPDGAFRLLRSADRGQSWHSVALISARDADLRDAKLNTDANGNLLLLGAGALHHPEQHSHQSYLWQSGDGYSWSAAQPVGEPDIWLWRMVWQQQRRLSPHCYAVGYRVGPDKLVRLYHGCSPLRLTPLADMLSGSYANESGLLFEPDGTALCLLRRDPDHGLFGQSKAPYTDWQWQDVGCRIGGPQWLQLPDGKLLACVRLYDEKVRTSLCWIDRQSGKLTEWQTLPSGGDCSYAGMVLRDDTLYISYYSSHEGKTGIYFSELNLPAH